MGFFRRIGSRFKKAKSIGSRIASKTSIGLRKVGHALDRVSGIGAKIGAVAQVAGFVTGNPVLAGVGRGISTVSGGLKQAGRASSLGNRGIKKIKGGKKQATQFR